MSYKDKCDKWVEERIFEDEDGFYEDDPRTGEPVDDVRYETEDEIRDELWSKVLSYVCC